MGSSSPGGQTSRRRPARARSSARRAVGSRSTRQRGAIRTARPRLSQLATSKARLASSAELALQLQPRQRSAGWARAVRRAAGAQAAGWSAGVSIFHSPCQRGSRWLQPLTTRGRPSSSSSLRSTSIRPLAGSMAACAAQRDVETAPEGRGPAGRAPAPAPRRRAAPIPGSCRRAGPPAPASGRPGRRRSRCPARGRPGAAAPATGGGSPACRGRPHPAARAARSAAGQRSAVGATGLRTDRLPVLRRQLPGQGQLSSSVPPPGSTRRMPCPLSVRRPAARGAGQSGARPA